MAQLRAVAGGHGCVEVDLAIVRAPPWRPASAAPALRARAAGAWAARPCLRRAAASAPAACWPAPGSRNQASNSSRNTSRSCSRLTITASIAALRSSRLFDADQAGRLGRQRDAGRVGRARRHAAARGRSRRCCRATCRGVRHRVAWYLAWRINADSRTQKAQRFRRRRKKTTKLSCLFCAFCETSASSASGTRIHCAHLRRQHLARQVARERRHVVALLEQDAGGVGHDFRVELQRVERHQRARPLDAFGDAGRALEGIGEGRAAQAPDEIGHLLRQPLAGLRHLRPHDRQLAFALGVVEPVVEAAALDRVVQFARAVAGEDRHRRHHRADGAELGNADLVFAQVLEQEGLEGLVGAIDLVDQQHRAGHRRLQRLQQRAPDQVVRLVDLGFDVARRALRLGRAHVQQLRRVVPFVERLALLQPVVALQPQQLARQRGGQRLGQLGLADAGLAFEQQRALQRAPGRRRSPAGGRRSSRRVPAPSMTESMVEKVIECGIGRRGRKGYAEIAEETPGFFVFCASAKLCAFCVRLSAFSAQRLCHCSLRQYADQVGAVGGRGMQVAVEVARIDLDARRGFGA